MDPEGNSYERSAIEQWLRTNSTSPITRARLTASMLIPNRALKESIELFLATHPHALSGGASSNSSSGAATVATVATAKATGFVNAPLDITASTYSVEDRTYLSVTATPPADGDEQPLDLIVALDTSGSMNVDVVSGAGTEKQSVPRIFLAKHGIRVLAALLGSKHRLAIVTFSSAARVVLPLTTMDAAGLARVDTVLRAVVADGQTNLYDAVRVSAEIANAADCAGRHVSCMILTDGHPTVEPPRGSTLKAIQAMAALRNPWTVHTFGFGCDLDSALLTSIAEWGNGQFGFIPSGDMLGTVFINAVANRLSVAHRGLDISYELSDGTKGVIATGSIGYGQPRHWTVPIDVSVAAPSLVTVTWSGGSVVTNPATAPPFVEARRLLLATVESAIRVGSGSVAFLTGFAETYAGSADPAVQALVRDVRSSVAGEQQVRLALDYFGTWGAHYLRAYARAQRLEECMNFKDPGLQIYGGALFTKKQNEGDALFVTLPPMETPPPPRPAYDYGGYGSHGGYTHSPMAALAAAPSRPLDMSSFHNSSGSCFAPGTRVLMAAGGRTPIENLQRGDAIWTPKGPGRVVHVITFNSAKRAQPMSQMGTLSITPYHPVIGNDGQWKNPADLVGYSDRLLRTVHNLVLDYGHIIDAEGIQCVTLGHEFRGRGIEHPFFGSEAAIEACLAKQAGYAEGRPLFHNCIATTGADGFVNGWVDV